MCTLEELQVAIVEVKLNSVYVCFRLYKTSCKSLLNSQTQFCKTLDTNIEKTPTLLYFLDHISIVFKILRYKYGSVLKSKKS